MPRTESVVTVFISSPSDVSAEREILDSVVNELNRTWSRTLGIRLEPIMWEIHSRPAFGNDPQDVLNDQLPDDYDVFLGILWGRIGTPTPRAESGTLEEFEHAFERYKNDKDSIELMVYFKDEGIAPSKTDPEQLAQVQKFKESLGEKGGLYSTFEDASSFESSLRAHLSSLAQKYSGISRSSQNEAKEISKPDSNVAKDVDISESEEIELGFFDYLEIYESQMSDMNSTLNVISEATVKIGNLMNKRVDEVNALEESERGGKPARKIVKMASDDISRFALALKQQLPLYSSARREAFDALSNALSLYGDFGDTEPDNLEQLDSGLNSMLNGASGAKASLIGFRDTIANLPRLSSELNRAKRGAVTQLDRMLDELDGTESTVKNILDSIAKMR
ncbi:MAG TPA: hypothetical protein ENJ60_08480 [Aeromonadales bacterium]|nr:hypothetical protein [Aeromonadales bacterium]